MNPIKEHLDDLKIDRPEGEPPRRKVWIPIAGIVLLMAALAGWWFSRSRAAEVSTAVAREVQVGGQRTVLNASGYVTARRQATVSSKVTGKVIEVLIEEGMAVDEGQVLARLDASNLTTELRLAEAQLSAAVSDLEETRVRLAEAKLDLSRIEKLVSDKVSSQAQLDAARAEADSLRARLASQQRAVEVAERSVAVRRQQLEDTVIRSPFAGIVVAKNAQPGEMISPISAGGGFTRTGIGTIVDMDSLEIEVDVNEAYINRVRPSQSVQATLDSYPEWQIPSTVIAIIPTADRQTATVRVRIGFDQLDPRILPDMGVKVAFQSVEQTETSVTAVVVPRRAILRDGDRDIVFVVRNGTAERRAVRLDDGDSKEAVILSGLAPGERVILEGRSGLRDGDVVKERNS
jgi:RND family efflux transporter MFP subunit